MTALVIFGLKLIEVVATGVFALVYLMALRRTSIELSETMSAVRSGGSSGPYRQSAKQYVDDGEEVDGSTMNIFDQARWTAMQQERDRYKQALDSIISVATNDTCTKIALVALKRTK